ncbi:MAG: hypothetical protein KJN90_12620 [Gammaproteobacteria bacterium]|nr:hypothetical protein [Gammaproteobacteria bacterium]
MMIVLAGLAVIISTPILPALRLPDGWLASQAALVMTSGAALAILGIFLRQRWQISGWLFSLALFGQGCALQLIFAPNYGIYQHYLALTDIVYSWRALCLALVMMHGLTVAWLYRKHATADFQRLKALLGTGKGLLLILMLLYACILFSTEGLQYGFGVWMVAWTGVFGGLNLLLAVRAIPQNNLDDIRQWAGNWLEGPGSERRNCWLPRIIALWVILVSALIAGWVYEGIPHISDSIAYLFQAKYFSAGLLYLPPPPDAASFHLSHLINDNGKWYGYGFPGWPSLLALGVLAGKHVTCRNIHPACAYPVTLPI